MTQLSIIAGLGNPEDRYERTLHNAGFWFVDALARKYGGDFRYDKKFDADCCKIRVGSSDHNGHHLPRRESDICTPTRAPSAAGDRPRCLSPGDTPETI